MCLNAVLASTGDRYQAEEMVAEAFARAWASWRKVSHHPSPQAWVVRTALNANVSWWRKHHREVPLDPQVEPAGESPGLSVDQTWPEASIMGALAGLTARQRQVVALRIFLDLDTTRTAEVLGIAPGTVTAHLARAIAALRDEFKSLDKQGKQP